MHGWGKDFVSKVEYVEVKKPSFLSYIFKSKAIIEELNRKVNAIEGSKQTLNRLENYIKILESKNNKKNRKYEKINFIYAHIA